MVEALYPHVLADHNHIPNTREPGTVTLFNHSSDHNKYAAEIVAIEREMGTNPAADYESVAARLDDFEFRINTLENAEQNQYVSKFGDIMTGALTLPEMIIGNSNTNLEGIRFNTRGYILPLENFQNDSFKILSYGGETLFEVPFNGSTPLIRGSAILTAGNHFHRTDEENEALFWKRTDRIGHRITLSGYDESYKEFILAAEGTPTLTLETADDNHFKIRSNGASPTLNLNGIPARDRRRGITICLQNLGNAPITMSINNSYTWADFTPTADQSTFRTNPGRDTEIFAYTIGEGDRWVLQPYYMNMTVRTLAAEYPAIITHHYKMFGRGSITPLTINEESGKTPKMNFPSNTTFTLEGAQFSASTRKYGYTDVIATLSLQNTVAVASVVRNIANIEEFAAMGAIATTARETNYLRVDKLSSSRMRGKIMSQTLSYENDTYMTPVLPLLTGSDLWTLVIGFKTPLGYGAYNVNKFAAGLPVEEYLAFREFPATLPVFDAADSMRLGVGILPRSTYTTSPTGLGTFTCAATYLLEGELTGPDIMQLYRAVRQEMLGLGLSSLPAPKI